jgi:hypothetical protein
MPTVDEELWVIPDVMIIIATHADIRSKSQEKTISGCSTHWKIPNILVIAGKPE